MHELLDKEVAAGTSPSEIFVCGLSQGGKSLSLICISIQGHKIESIHIIISFVFTGALAIASVLLYPKTLGGCAVFSGSVPLNKSFAEKVSSDARKVITRSHAYVQNCIFLTLKPKYELLFQTPVLWFHGMADGLVLFEAGHAGCAFLEELGMSCEFKVMEESIYKAVVNARFKHFSSLQVLLQSANICARFQTYLTVAICLFSQSSNQAYPTLGHSMVDEELQYFQQWILNRLGMTVSGATETARPSSSSNHKDPQ